MARKTIQERKLPTVLSFERKFGPIGRIILWNDLGESA